MQLNKTIFYPPADLLGADHGGYHSGGMLPGDEALMTQAARDAWAYQIGRAHV